MRRGFWITSYRLYKRGMYMRRTDRYFQGLVRYRLKLIGASRRVRSRRKPKSQKRRKRRRKAKKRKRRKKRKGIKKTNIRTGEKSRKRTGKSPGRNRNKTSKKTETLIPLNPNLRRTPWSIGTRSELS